MQALKLGLVGCGWAGQQAVKAARASALTQVVALADLDEPRRRQLAREEAVPRQYGPYQELLADDQVEAVYLAVNPPARYPMVLDALAAGKHVLVQKPHAVRAAHIREFEAAAQGAGTTLQFCYFMRHFPQHRSLRAAVQGGRIGEPYHARIFLKFNSRPPADSFESWTNVYGDKGGALGQHASHELDLAWWWMGCPKPEWAYAVKHTLEPLYHGPEGSSEDYFSGLVGLAGGKTIQVDCSRWLHCDTPTVVELYGRRGALSQGRLWHWQDGQFTELGLSEEADMPYTQPPVQGLPFYHEIEHFARAVAGQVEPDVNAGDAYHFMQVLDALYDSARSNEKVTIDK